MTQTQIKGKFYPLKSEEWLESIKQLTHSELKILYYVRSLDPYNNGINLTPAQIAKDLSTEKSPMHRSTVGRALKSLDHKGFIQMELLRVRIKVNPKGFLSEEVPEDVVSKQQGCEQTTPVATAQHTVQLHNTKCSHATPSAPTQQSKAETQLQKEFQVSKINKNYLDFKDSLSQSERDNFLRFVEQKIQNLEKPINDLEAWLASQTKAKQNRWEVYYQSYKQQEAQKTTEQCQSSDLAALEAKKLAIKNWQEYLQQQKLKAKQTRKDKKPNLESQQQSKAVTDLLRRNSVSGDETHLSDVSKSDSVCYSGQAAPSQESEEDFQQKIDQILKDFSRVEPDELKIPPQKPERNLSQKIHQGLQYLRTLDVRKRFGEEVNQDIAGEQA
jgi:hypothetical protein